MKVRGGELVGLSPIENKEAAGWEPLWGGARSVVADVPQTGCGLGCAEHPDGTLDMVAGFP
jgi:hypothetical protein